jgi:hypothetical protein
MVRNFKFFRGQMKGLFQFISLIIIAFILLFDISSVETHGRASLREIFASLQRASLHEIQMISSDNENYFAAGWNLSNRNINRINIL